MEDFDQLDTNFCLQNFNYIFTKLGNEEIKSVYEKLGPFNFQKYDHYQFPSFFDDDEKAEEMKRIEETRYQQNEFEVRKSGAIYRGEALVTNGRPDGKGFKIFKGQSIYEGWFMNGLCSGYGRAITSRGEIYQGKF